MNGEGQNIISELFNKFEEDLIDSQISVLICAGNTAQLTKKEPSYSLFTSFIGTFWGYIMSYYSKIYNNEDHPLPFKSLVKHMCHEESGISYSFDGKILCIPLTNCSFYYYDNCGAYGGPTYLNDELSGGIQIYLPIPIFLNIMDYFDEYIPELKQYFAKEAPYIIEEATKKIQRLRELEIVLSKETLKYEDAFFLISDYNRKTAEVTINAGGYLGKNGYKIVVAYELFLRNAINYCRELYDVICNPKRINLYNYIVEEKY